jgi:hypothetical protein
MPNPVSAIVIVILLSQDQVKALVQSTLCLLHWQHYHDGFQLIFVDDPAGRLTGFRGILSSAHLCRYITRRFRMYKLLKKPDQRSTGLTTKINGKSLW